MNGAISDYSLKCEANSTSLRIETKEKLAKLESSLQALYEEELRVPGLIGSGETFQSIA